MKARQVWALLLVAALLAIPAAALGKIKARSLSGSQAAALAHGFKVKVTNRGRDARKVRIAVESRTFDDPSWTKLTKRKRVRLAPRSHRKLKLKLTGAGRDAVAACGARDLRVRVGGRAKRRELVRDTPTCAPKPIDLSRAGECDFIGQQDGSLCMLPFPDDFYTAADPSSATGPPDRFQVRGDARERLRYAGRRRALQPERRLQPRAIDRAEGPGPRHAGGARADRPGGSSTISGRYSRPGRAGGRDRRRDGRARADLGRARLQRDQRREDRADGQPGGQPRGRGTATSSPCATCAPPTVRPSRRPRASATTATTCRHSEPAIEAQRGRFDSIFDEPARRRDPALEPLPGVGLHRRQRPQHRRADAAHPRRRLRRARATRRWATSPLRARRRRSHRSAFEDFARAARAGREDRPRDRGHVHRAVLPRSPTALPAGASRSAPTGCRRRQRRLRGQLRLHRSRVARWTARAP